MRKTPNLLAGEPHPSHGFICLWHNDCEKEEPDTHVAFRGCFDLTNECEVEFRFLGASWYVVWLDGQLFSEGPPRFGVGNPEFQTVNSRLKAGRHVFAVQVHHLGVSMRILNNVPPFLWCVASVAGEEIELVWKALRLEAYRPKFRRINAQLGWAEWCDTRNLPEWKEPEFDDSEWGFPLFVSRPVGDPEPLRTANPHIYKHTFEAIAQGKLAEIYGYQRDNPQARFFLRDLAPTKLPPQGVWRRYDLGRVRLMRPRFMIDVPSGAQVEVAYCEALQHGRVSPWITLSASDSCNLDHYFARGGPQEFCPLTPKGGRFVEVHVIAPPDEVRFLREEFVERAYYGDAEGNFECDDELLNRIWSVGVATHQACSEDALVDNPTRERGQWAGDVVTVGMDIAGAAFSDLRLCRRGLVQCAQSARADGLVSGMCPGQDVFLSTYAAQWISACVHYFELTGDRLLLEEMFEAAQRNLAAFEARLTPDGLESTLGWGFVDWGYVPNPGTSDMGVNLHYVAALRDMQRWCHLINRSIFTDHYRELDERVTRLLHRYYDEAFSKGAEAWEVIGYHRATLGMRLNFFSKDREKVGLDFMKAHMLRCFPNDSGAPRLSEPSANNSRLITPYFAHYAMPLLVENGEIDFVLGQYRTCWGWALEDDRTTWLEVFDTRWSHCHQWAGCPTWQLSRYLLGLRARQDLGPRHYALALFSGQLNAASGRMPIAGMEQTIDIRWTRKGSKISYRLETPIPIFLHFDQGTEGAEAVEVRHVFETTFS